MKLTVYKDGNKIELEVKKLSLLGRFFGLIFRTKNTKNLLFDFSYDVKISIHSLFVFFPFLAIWLDSKNRVLDYNIVRPFRFRIRSKNKFRKIVEIPINKRNDKIIKLITQN